MYSHRTHLRVRYAETDQMGYVYYGNYAQYCEVGRVEMLRSLGFSYRSLEQSGVLLPVLNYSTQFIKPARYDDELELVTELPELPTARIQFDYSLFNPHNEELLNRAHTTLVFIDAKSQKPRRAPKKLIENLQGYFKG